MNLKHSTEYARFGKAVYGHKDSHKIFLERPSLVKDTTRFVFLSAFYKYMTPIYPKPSAHQVVTGQWYPNSNDVATGNFEGFGTTINLLYGETECNMGDD